MKIFSHGCTLDCFDTCKFNVYVDEGKISRIEGDKNHPYTKGMICSKGRQHLARLNHPKRIYTPMRKTEGKWEEISFTEAIDLLADKLLDYKEKFGSCSVLHYYESGSGGILKSIEDVFFNFYGGITLPKGSTCWGAGIAAQRYDFGDVRGHQLDDMLNSKNIFIWGRNPANTSLHLYSMIKQAKKNGIKIVVIDPLDTDTAKLADLHIRINPAKDGALAMAMAKLIIESGFHDEQFISRHVLGFAEYKKYLENLDLDYLSDETGVSTGAIKKLAYLYAGEKPSCIYIGYGMQKYKNGGNSVRAIDALGAITGNIGVKGGGVNYANRVYPDVLDLDPYNSNSYAVNKRFFCITEFSEYISCQENPPIKAVFVTKANPAAQLPDLNKFMSAFDSVEFKVCIDMFMTDTASHCDLVIPCTNSLESEDIVYSSMNNPYIIYNEKAVEPREELMDEYYFFQALAQKMNMTNYPLVEKEEYLERVIAPLKEKGVELTDIKNSYVNIQQDNVAWHDLVFKTPSGKYEIYSEKAKFDGFSPIPVLATGDKTRTCDIKYKKIRLITIHPKNSLFSQHFLDVDGKAVALINPKLASAYGINEGDNIILSSENGQIKVDVCFDEGIPANIVAMSTGWWHKHGNPNFLTNSICADMGGQVAYHETFVNLYKK